VSEAKLEVFLRKIRRLSCFLGDLLEGFGCNMVSSMGGVNGLSDKMLLPIYLITVIQTSEVHSRARWPVRRLDGM
jgi:hypothetical protein